MTLAIQSQPFAYSPPKALAFTPVQERIYWKILQLIGKQTNEILVITPGPGESWKDVRVVVEALVFDLKVIKSYATAADNATCLLKVEENDRENPQVSPTSSWFSLAFPVQRSGEPHSVSTSTSFSPAQIQFLAYVHDAIAGRPDRNVIAIDPSSFSSTSPAPERDLRWVLEYMLYEERSIIAIASYPKGFLVMATAEDIVESAADVERTSDWISLANPAERVEQNPSSLISTAAKQRHAQLSSFLESYIFYKSKGNLILELLPLIVSVEDLSFMKREGLVQLLLSSDDAWVTTHLPHLDPLFLKSLVRTILSMPCKSETTVALLEKIVRFLLTLPPGHRNVKAFIAGFPSMNRPPLLPFNYYQMHNWLQKEYNKHSKIRENCTQFIQTDSFILLFNHLSSTAEREKFLCNLFSHIGFFSLWVFFSDKTFDQLFAFIKPFDTYWQRLMLRGLSCAQEARLVAKICLHPAADAPLIDSVLKDHSADKESLCKDESERKEHLSNPDPFFKALMLSCASPTSELRQALTWIADSLVRSGDERRKQILFESFPNLETAALVNPLPYSFERLRKTFEEWKERVLNPPYDLHTTALTRDLEHLFQAAPEEEQNQMAIEFAQILDAHSAVSFDLGKWLQQDKKIHVYTSNFALPIFLRMMTAIKDNLKKRDPHSRDDTGLDELICFISKIFAEQSFSIRSINSSLRGYHLGKEKALFYVNYETTGLQKADPEAFRPCQSRPNMGRPVAFFKEGKFHTTFVLPCGAERVDVVPNERYISFYARGNAFGKQDYEQLIQLDWKSCFEDAEPTLSEMRQNLEKGEFQMKAGIFRCLIPLETPKTAGP